jgi:HTH-type transcriptional regulator, sugar sensing transcriptional regulator
VNQNKISYREILREIGLTEPESLVYLASLEAGAEGASVIAKRAKLKRGQTYNVLNSLISRGLIQEFERSGTKQFVASSPETLLSYLERREEELERNRDELLQALPTLEKLRGPSVIPPKIRFFQGLDGVREVIMDSIQVPDSEVFAFIDLEKRNIDLGPEASDFIDDYAATRIERNIWLYAIVPQNSLAKEDKHRGASGPIMRRHFRTLPGYNPTAEIFIYRGRVSIVTCWKQKIALTIEDESIYDTYVALHQALWKLLPKTDEVVMREVVE